MIGAHVSRRDEKGASSARAGVDPRIDDANEPSGVSAFIVGVGAPGRAMAGALVAEHGERARLIADLANLIREPSVPEPTRLAGLTLIGWLARRPREESPHAIGITEARASERRIRAGRAKSR